MRLGIICRYDEGGLATQTIEYARHLQPHAILALSVPPARGEEKQERFAGLAERYFWSHFPVRPAERRVWREFAEACDVVLTAETCYLREFPQLCEQEGCRLVVHANPELWEWGRLPPLEPWAPTSWMLTRLPEGTPVVPVPVDRQRCAPRAIADPPRRLLHISAPAMLDRNGTKLIKQALNICSSEFDLLVAGPEAPLGGPVGFGRGRRIVGVPRVENYWRLYDDADALVLPRRYGGLCLPMQEAASCGLPIISLNVEPQRARLLPELAVESDARQRAQMKGGSFSVWTADPRWLAASIDQLCSGAITEEAVAASEAWAADLDWSAWEPRYAALLGTDKEAAACP